MKKAMTALAKRKNKLLLIIIFACQFLFSFSANNSLAQDAKAENPTSDNYKLTIDKIDPSRFYNVAVVQVLNKITGKSSTFNMKIGEEVSFGKLTMTAKKCWKASLDQSPESKILLEVFDYGEENSNNKEKKRIFYGWMFSSSPSISGIEHPIYDIVAISCKNK